MEFCVSPHILKDVVGAFTIILLSIYQYLLGFFAIFGHCLPKLKFSCARVGTDIR